MPCSLWIILPAYDISCALFPTPSRVSLEFVHLAPTVFPACWMQQSADRYFLCDWSSSTALQARLQCPPPAAAVSPSFPAVFSISTVFSLSLSEPRASYALTYTLMHDSWTDACLPPLAPDSSYLLLDVRTTPTVAFTAAQSVSPPSGSDRTALHPCTDTAAHHLHTRPPDICIASPDMLVSHSYCYLELRSSPSV